MIAIFLISNQAFSLSILCYGEKDSSFFMTSEHPTQVLVGEKDSPYVNENFYVAQLGGTGVDMLILNEGLNISTADETQISFNGIADEKVYNSFQGQLDVNLDQISNSAEEAACQVVLDRYRLDILEGLI